MQQFHYIPRHISAASLLVLCIAGSTGAALLPLLILIFDQQHSVGNAPPRRLHGLRIAVVSIWVMGLTAGLPPLISTNYHVRNPLSDWYQSTAISMCLIEVCNFTKLHQKAASMKFVYSSIYMSHLSLSDVISSNDSTPEY